MVYQLLVRFLRLVTSIFFRTVEVVGLEQIPGDQPVLFVGNHPNSLMDPLLITATCGRRLSLAAKDTLFEFWLPRQILKALGAVPVRRRMDNHGKGSGGLDNETAFEALFQVLDGGGACGIFPEGISHSGSQLAPLKTGAARIALGASRRHPERPVRIIPCGLSYHRRTRMRGQVLVQYGSPLVMDAARLDAHGADERSAVRALTEDIETALRSLTINAPDFRTLHVLDAVRRIYVPLGDRLNLAQQAELTRRLLDRYQDVAEQPEVLALYEDVSRYVDDLDALGLSDRELVTPPSRWHQARRVLRHLSLIVFLAPLAVPGLVLHCPLLLAAVVAGDGLTPRKDVIATTKMMTLTLLVPGVYALIVAAVLWLAAPPVSYYLAGALALVLPLTGLATIRVFERQAALRRGLATLSSLLVLPRELERLRDRRQGLRSRIWKVVDTFAPPEVERMFEEQA